MFTKGNKIYSEAYKYLRNGSAVGFQLIYDGCSTEDFSEIPLDLDLKIIESGRVRIGNYFIIRPKDFSYASIKTAIIKMRYSDDDQMALILNKDDSPEDEMLYQKMQEWREFAGDVASKVQDLL